MKDFTTGQVAKICKVAPRTVSKWFDRGSLKGYLLPGSKERRIPPEYLLKFLKGNSSMPLWYLTRYLGQEHDMSCSDIDDLLGQPEGFTANLEQERAACLEQERAA